MLMARTSSLSTDGRGGQDDRLPNLATELVRLEPDIIVTTGTPGTLAAMHATKTIPIVMASAGDPVGVGLVASLVRPGRRLRGDGQRARGGAPRNGRRDVSCPPRKARRPGGNEPAAVYAW